MKMSLRIIMIISILALSGCITITSGTSLPSSAIAQTPRLTATLSLHPTLLAPTPTSTSYTNYQPKDILFEYYEVGDHSYFDSYFDTDSTVATVKIVIYTDGQTIIAGDSYATLHLSQAEIEQFQQELTNLGFFSLETNGQHDSSDKLYNYDANHHETLDGQFLCVSTLIDQEKTICEYEPDRQYVNSSMLEIINFLDNYQPTRMTTYIPDRLLVLIQKGGSGLQNPNIITPIPWSENFPSLDNSQQMLFVTEKLAQEIYSLIKNSIHTSVVTLNGNDYTLMYRVVFPHEILVNP